MHLQNALTAALCLSPSKHVEEDKHVETKCKQAVNRGLDMLFVASRNVHGCPTGLCN